MIAKPLDVIANAKSKAASLSALYAGFFLSISGCATPITFLASFNVRSYQPTALLSRSIATRASSAIICDTFSLSSGLFISYTAPPLSSCSFCNASSSFTVPLAALVINGFSSPNCSLVSIIPVLGSVLYFPITL